MRTKLARAFWPGPLTLVVPKSAAIPAAVTAGLDTVGLRMPAHPVALELLRAAELPIAAPSANRFTELSPVTAAHVRASLGDAVDMILDGGPCSVELNPPCFRWPERKVCCCGPVSSARPISRH